MRKTRSTGSLKKSKTAEKKTAQESGKYQFLNKTYSKYLNCPICKSLMKSPMRLHPCGHSFCSECTPSKGKCPECAIKITEVQKDLVGEGLINQMTVRCLNDGCPYKGTFDQYKKFHQSKCALGKGFDEWLKSMKALDQHNQIFRRKNSSDQERPVESQKDDTIVKASLDLRRPKSPAKAYDYDQELLQKTLKAEL